VTDNDGYLNVRNSEGGSIKDTISEGTLFFVDVESMHRFENKVDSNWIQIIYPTDLLHDQQEFGWVHKSRVTPIESLSVSPKELPILLFDFIPYSPQDGSFSSELRTLSMVLDNDTLVLPKSYYQSTFSLLFEPGKYASDRILKEYLFSTYRYKTYTYYRILLSPGAEHTELILVFQKDKLISRLYGWHI
jgi:hypothetical protein